MPADFLANNFEAIARAMRREKPSSPALLCFWDMSSLRTSVHESVEAAVEEAHRLTTNHTGIPVRITAPDGMVLMDDRALIKAVARHRRKMPT